MKDEMLFFRRSSEVQEFRSADDSAACVEPWVGRLVNW